MELNFLYNDGSHLKKISFNATEITDQTFLMSQVGGFREGTKNVGWCPKINNQQFRTTEPRYFGTTRYQSILMGPGITSDYSRFFPDELVSAINKFPAGNTYTLTSSSNFLGTKPSGSQYYTGVPLLREVDGAYKKVCNLLWAYNDQPIPGQSIHAYYNTGFWGFSYPSDEFPNAVMYSPTRNEYQFQGELPEIKMSLWIITVQDDVTGSVSYGHEYRLLAQVIKVGTSNSMVSFIDMRLLNGADEEGQPTPNGSDPKKNSTPSGWGGTRNTASSNDVITSPPYAIARTVNFGGDEGHGIYLYKIDAANLAVVAQSLWASSLFDKFRDVIYSPSSGILGCHILPYKINSDEMVHTVKLCGTEAKFANTETDVKPNQVPGLNPIYTYAYANWAVAAQNHHSESFYVEPFFNSFLDFEPYTKIQLRLPFIGTVPIPTSAVMGGYILVNYILDNRNGNLVAQVYAISMRNHETNDANGGILIGQWSGNCALSMSLTGNSMGSQEVVGAIKGFASNAVGTIIQDNSSNQTSPVGGLVSAGVNAGLDILTARHEPRLFGTLNSGAGPLTDLTCRLIITRPVDVTPGSYKVVDGTRVFSADGLLEQKGLASYSGGTVAQYSGVTQGYVLGNIDGATEGEIKEIRRLFAEGVNIRG